MTTDAGTPPAGTPPAGTPPAGTPPAGTPPAGTPPAAFDWKAAGGLDDTSLALVNERQWKGPSDLITSYRNLEKLTGVPPEQIVKLPKDANPEAWNQVYDRLGRPKTAAEYKLPVPEGDKGEFAGIASGWFHELGLSVTQGQKLAAKQNEYVAALTKKQADDYAADVKKQDEALNLEWGEKRPANIAIAKQAAKTFGMTEDQVAALEKTLGFAGVHKFLFNIGAKLGEASFVEGDGAGKGGFHTMTPEMARGEIKRLESDKAFAEQFSSTDARTRAEAREKMSRLHKIAWPT